MHLVNDRAFFFVFIFILLSHMQIKRLASAMGEGRLILSSNNACPLQLARVAASRLRAHARPSPLPPSEICTVLVTLFYCSYLKGVRTPTQSLQQQVFRVLARLAREILCFSHIFSGGG